jgi:ferric-dicitrate binding protein FerR (iron transport regulator)
MSGAAAMSGHRLFARHWMPARYALAILLGILVLPSAPSKVPAQTNGCALSPDERNPTEKVLRCGDHLTIRSAPDTRYRLTGQQGDEPPKGVELDTGALIIDFNPRGGRRSFQILTPHAIAAVRGTTWAIEIDHDWTSVFVIRGYVEVRRPNESSGVVLRATQGTDVTAGTRPITVRRWPKPRVDALLARFGM